MAYVDGAYRAYAAARVHVEDRGFQFADGVYEVFGVHRGKLVNAERHLARLERSLVALRIARPMVETALRAAVRETLRRNRVTEGLAYLQISRGAAPREHAFPDPAPKPTLVIIARRIDCAARRRAIDVGIAVATMPDERWGRCDIKSTALLANVLAIQAAKERAAAEAWLIDRDGFVTEGARSSAWIVTAGGVLVTRDLGANILPGVTRAAALAAVRALGGDILIEERPFTLAETIAAREAFITSAGNPLTPVVRVDGSVIGAGAPGPITARLRAAYLAGAGVDI